MTRRALYNILAHQFAMLDTGWLTDDCSEHTGRRWDAFCDGSRRAPSVG